jgi:hypothetical protein
MKRLSQVISGGDGLWGVRPQPEDEEGDGIRQQRGPTLRIVIAFLFCVLFATPGLAEPWKFIAVADSQGSSSYNPINTTILGEIVAEIVDQDVDLAVIAGDLVWGYGTQAALESELLSWRGIMQPVYNAGIDVYPIRGNHDIGTNAADVTAWNNVFSDDYLLPQNGPAGEMNLTYSVAHQNALFLGLDEYIASHRVNQAWVDEQLAGNTKPHVFAFGHEAAFQVSQGGILALNWAARNAFWKSLQDGGARAYFCGHDHFFNQANTDDDGDPSNDVQQFVVGTGGGGLWGWSGYIGNNADWTLENVYYERQFGYILGEIDGLDVSFTWMSRTSPGVYEAKNTSSYTAIPEPSMLSMIAAGAVFVWTFLRRRR